MGDDYYLQLPKNQTFYKVFATIMSLVGVGNRETWGYQKVPRIFQLNSLMIFIFGPVVGFSQFLFLYFNFHDLEFDTLGIIFSIWPASLLACVNIYSSKFNNFKIVIKEFMTQIHVYNVYKNNDEFVKKQVILTERLVRFAASYLIFFFISNCLGWVFIPAVNNYRNGDFIANRTMKLQTCVYLWVPLDYSYNYNNWIVIHTINAYIIACGVTVLMQFQSLNNIVLLNIIAHIKILKNNIQNTILDNLSNADVREHLIGVIKYHLFIINQFKKAQSAFGVNVAAIYVQNLFGNSVLLYQLKYGGKENIMLYITMIMAYTGGPILISFVVDEVKRQADDLPDLVYGMPWENMSVSNQKTAMLLLQKVQIPMEFEALGGLIAGVRPMISILKTTFSYYVMLESSMESKSA
nr:uncharacterized protein LOC116768467 [Danaus plexippus plexippus]